MLHYEPSGACLLLPDGFRAVATGLRRAGHLGQDAAGRAHRRFPIGGATEGVHAHAAGPHAVSKGLPETFSSRQTGKNPNGLEPPAGSCQRTTTRKNTRSAKGYRHPGRTGRRPAVPSSQPATLDPMTERSPKEVHLSNPAIRSARFTAPNPYGARRRERVGRPGDGGLCRLVRRCVSASARQDYSVRTCYNAATTATERSSRTSRYIPASQLATPPRPLAPPSGLWPATSTASPATGCWCLMPMTRPPLSARTVWPPDRCEGWGEGQIS